MTLALLSTAQHVSDVNTSIFRSLRLFVALLGRFEACWCYVAGLYVGDVVSECRLKQAGSAYTGYISNMFRPCLAIIRFTKFSIN